MVIKKQKESMWEPNPERYAKCREPFADSEIANAAMEAFLDDVSAAREKHNVCDVSIIIKDSYGKADEAAAFMSTAHFGNGLEREVMIAYALGRVQKERQELIGRLLSGKGGKD